MSYEQKHNEANGEQNRDGHSANHSFNCGVEGYTSDQAISKLRLQQQKNMLLTLLLSKGVPMLSLGSEMAHSQGGNNNAYCQNNRTSWLAWKESQFNHPLTRFIDDVLRLRKQFSVFQHPFFVHDGDPRYAVAWFTESGTDMQQDDWHQSDRQFLMYSLTDKHTKQALLIILNAGSLPITCQLPRLSSGQWSLALTSIHSVSTANVDTEQQIAAMSSWVFTADSEDLSHD